MAPVKLPRYVIFQGDNGYNLCLWYQEKHEYLMFNSTNRDMWGAQEVIPVSGQENVVMIKSMYNNKFWRRSPNWIWADQSDKPSTDHSDCQFKVVRINDETVALQSLANGNYLKRLTTEGKTSCLNAAAPDYSTDVTAQLRVTEALSMRRMFDVEYQMNQMRTTKLAPIFLGSSTGTNKSNSKTDLQVTVGFEVEKQSSWRTSTTFTTGLSMTVTAGIPDIASVSGTVSREYSTTVEMGKMQGEKILQSTTVTVKDVAPGDSVKVEVSGTEAKGRVPFKYKTQDTRVDGLIMPEETGDDGVFEGVQVIDVKWIVTDPRGNPKQTI